MINIQDSKGSTHHIKNISNKKFDKFSCTDTHPEGMIMGPDFFDESSKPILLVLVLGEAN